VVRLPGGTKASPTNGASVVQPHKFASSGVGRLLSMRGISNYHCSFVLRCNTRRTILKLPM